MNDINAIVFDMDGVIRIGERLIDGAVETFKRLNTNGIQTMIVTNECRYTVDELREELEDLGLPLSDSVQFYTAALSARDYLCEKLKRFPEEQIHIGILGESGLYQTINTLSSYTNCIVSNEISERTQKNARLYLVIGTVNRIKITHLDMILKWIKLGARVILTCPDTSDPSSKGDFNLGMPSHMLHMTRYNIKTNSYSTGKPHPIHRKEIMKRLDIKDPSKILFVGDTIYTDIRLAEESGFKSCLVLSGNTKIEGLGAYTIDPDFVINDITELDKIIQFK